MRKLIYLVIVIVLIWLGYSFIKSKTPVGPVEPAPTESAKSATQAPASKVVSVNINGFAFAPASLTVKRGTTVTWTNDDSAPHTVTGDTGGPSSGTLQKGGSYSYVFSSTGTFAYHCAIHSTMKASVIVTE